MFEPISRREEQTLAKRLRTEAEQSRPAFSEDLHERMARAVARQRAEQPVAGIVGGRGRVETAWWAMAAAACLLLMAILTGRSGPHKPAPETAKIVPVQPKSPIVAPASSEADVAAVAELADAAREQIGTVITTTVSHRQWAYLDQDLSDLAETWANRYPFDQVAESLRDSNALSSRVTP